MVPRVQVTSSAVKLTLRRTHSLSLIQPEKHNFLYFISRTLGETRTAFAPSQKASSTSKIEFWNQQVFAQFLLCTGDGIWC